MSAKVKNDEEEGDESSDKMIAATRDEFVAQWGAVGNAWGINRTMAQIHALLLVSDEAMTTDDVMEDLRISRGNAHMNLRELVGWGLVRSVIRKGERREYFEAEKDVWRMFCIIARERRRREIEPAVKILRDCRDRTKKIKGPGAAAMGKQLQALCQFVELADGVLDKISRSESSAIVPLMIKLKS